MASEVEIGNLAVAHLAEIANISDFNEGSTYGDFCRMFYPIARDLLLQEGWTFNTRRATLAEFTPLENSQWQFAYATPVNMAYALAVLAPGGCDDSKIPYAMETIDDGTIVLLTNQDQAILRYTVKITDTSKFSPLFTDTLSWLLASYLAGPVLKGKDGMAAGRAAYQTYQTQLAHALAKDRGQSYQTQSDMSAGISARYGSEPVVGYQFPRSY